MLAREHERLRTRYAGGHACVRCTCTLAAPLVVCPIVSAVGSQKDDHGSARSRRLGPETGPQEEGQDPEVQGECKGKQPEQVLSQLPAAWGNDGVRPVEMRARFEYLRAVKPIKQPGAPLSFSG